MATTEDVRKAAYEAAYEQLSTRLIGLPSGTSGIIADAIACALIAAKEAEHL